MNVLGLKAEPIPVVRIGIVGLGMRGKKAVERLCQIPGTKIIALCDVRRETVLSAQSDIKSRFGVDAAVFYGEDGYRKLCEREDIELVYVVTTWQTHVEIALEAMNHGKHVAVEVPAALTVQDCWDIVNTAERTRRHCMMLEKCVYDEFEMTCLNMARQGFFGELVHVKGGYLHSLESYWNDYADNWRLEYNRQHAGDIYPTHGLGPCCQLLGIHREDSLDYLVSMSSESITGRKMAKELIGADDFANGDHTITLIRTKKGRLIELQHNVMNPQPYSRMYQVVGTEGFANKYPVEGIAKGHEFLSQEKKDELLKRYRPALLNELYDKAVSVCGKEYWMDYVMDYRLIHCLHEGEPLDMDVYDLAEWCCISELSEESIRNGSKPVKIPEFLIKN